MKLITLNLLCVLLPLGQYVHSFTPIAMHRQAGFAAESTVLYQSSTSSVPITVSGNNVEVTAALRDYVTKRLENVLGKLSSSGAIQECDVHLTVNKNHKVKNRHKAEVVTAVKGTTFRCAEETPDMYASIDAVTDRLKRKLRQYKERRLDGYHGGPHMGSNLAEAFEDIIQPLEENSASDASSSEDEDYVDPEAPVITKIKSYDLSKGISVQEAIFALDYVDHDFYVFRDEATNDINVVYKRNAGGYGLIQPQ